MNLTLKGENVDLGFPNPEINETPTVFIGKIELTSETAKKLNSQKQRELYLFGAAVKTGEKSLKFGELKAAQFVVFEKNVETNEIINHKLAQHSSEMYKQQEDNTAAGGVTMLKKDDIRYLYHLPKWKASEAGIPTYNGELFYFVAQFFIPDNATNRQHLTFDTTAFVFVIVTEQDELLIHIYCQDTSEQTAEDHYRLEEMMCEYDRNYRNLNTVRNLIEEGDKHFHEYVFKHKKTSKDILEILLEHAKTKAMKTSIEKRLK